MTLGSSPQSKICVASGFQYFQRCSALQHAHEFASEDLTVESVAADCSAVGVGEYGSHRRTNRTLRNSCHGEWKGWWRQFYMNFCGWVGGFRNDLVRRRRRSKVAGGGKAMLWFVSSLPA